MTKTFKANESTSDARVIKVGPWTNPGVELIVELGDRWGKGIVIPPADAPALALAILEAAGVEAIPFDEGPETIPGHAVWALRHHVQASEAKAKEAADREALETRRNELVREFRGDGKGKYEFCSPLSQQAIDRVIELEGGAKS